MWATDSNRLTRDPGFGGKATSGSMPQLSPMRQSLWRDSQNPRHHAFPFRRHYHCPVGFRDFCGSVFAEVVEEGEEVFAFDADFGVVEGQGESSV